VAIEDFEAWRRSGRPYGYFGVSIDPMGPHANGTLPDLAAIVESLPAGFMDKRLKSLLESAAFVYCRDSLSLRYVRRQEVAAPIVEWGPDATFAFELADEDAAATWLDAFGLAEGRFACVIPRSRYAPYHQLRDYPPEPRDMLRDAVNAVHTPGDMGVLAAIITETVRRSELDVLICPEMKHVVELARAELLPRLPDDVRSRVHHLPAYWEQAGDGD
jgi:hypothetical protein